MQIKTDSVKVIGYAQNTEELGKLSDILCPNFINQCIETTDESTIRKRRVPLDMAVWVVIPMSLYRLDPVWSIVSKANLMLLGKKPLMAPNTVVQAHQCSGKLRGNTSEPRITALVDGEYFKYVLFIANRSSSVGSLNVN